MARRAMFVVSFCPGVLPSHLQTIGLMAFVSSSAKKLVRRLLSHPGLCLLFVFFTIATFLQLIGHLNFAGIHRRFFGVQFPRAECRTRPKYNLTVMTVFKDTAPYLKEWLEFHFMCGVERFYLYDNNSTDKPLVVLKPYIAAGTVIYRFWPNHFHIDFDGFRENYSQKAALEDAILTYRCQSRWMALIDTDEFLMPGKNFLSVSLQRLLKQYEQFGGLAVAWLQFGTSGHARPPAKLVTEAYTYRRASAERHFKHIVQPRRLRGFMNVHKMFYFDGYTAVDERQRPVVQFINQDVHKTFEFVRLHHYFTRSCVDWWIRVNQRGCVSGGLTKYTFDDLKKLDNNDVSDETALPVAARLRTHVNWDGSRWQKDYFPANEVPKECKNPSRWKAKFDGA